MTQGTDVSVYNYNGLGDRLQQNFNNAPTNFTVDLNAGLTQVLADGTNSYAYGLDLLSQQSGPSERYFMPDALGSTRQLTEQTSAITFSTSFDPFGNVISSDGGGSVFGFTGEQTDVTGLVYLRARYYAPEQGRFITQDPFAGFYNLPVSLNQFAYSYGNPVSNTDSNGMCPKPTHGMFRESSGSIVCIAAFIPTKYSEVIPNQIYYTGDNRGFSSNSKSSRMWMWIDGVTGELLSYNVHETCRTDGSFTIQSCVGPRNVENDVTTSFNSYLKVSSNGTGQTNIAFGIICNDKGLYNLFCALTFFGNISLTSYDPGNIYSVYANVSRFPNYEGWLWQGENQVTKLFAIQNFSAEELQSGIADAGTPIAGYVLRSLYSEFLCLPFNLR